MKRTRNLHILFPEKFFREYIHFVNENFDPGDHLFLYLRVNGKEPRADNVKTMRYYRFGLLFYWEMFRYARNSDNVILHSLSKSKVISFLFLFPSVRKKSIWFLWGGDLYYRIKKYSKKIYNPWSKFVFKSVVRQLGSVVSPVKGDVDLAKYYFDFRGKHIDCFLYPSNLFKPLNLEPENSDTLWIQVGNSSHTSNNHIEALQKIEYLKNEDVRIICPLSYGDRRNATKVATFGKGVFHEKFIPLTNFTPLEEYLNLLSKIDVAIFNHWRQQGLGNIISLLGLGKTVYLRQDITTWSMLEEMGITVRSFNSFSHIELLTESERISNIEIVKMHFSLRVLKAQSAAVFS